MNVHGIFWYESCWYKILSINIFIKKAVFSPVLPDILVSLETTLHWHKQRSYHVINLPKHHEVQKSWSKSWPGSLTIFDCGCVENYIDVAEGAVETLLRKQHDS